jgi:hypothetical protein
MRSFFLGTRFGPSGEHGLRGAVQALRAMIFSPLPAGLRRALEQLP